MGQPKKHNSITQALSKRNHNRAVFLDGCYILAGTLMCIMFPLRLVWRLFFQLPYERNIPLGFFRFAVMLILCYVWDDQHEWLCHGWEIKTFLISVFEDDWGNSIFILSGGAWPVNLLFSLLVAGGMHTGELR